MYPQQQAVQGNQNIYQSTQFQQIGNFNVQGAQYNYQYSQQGQNDQRNRQTDREGQGGQGQQDDSRSNSDRRPAVGERMNDNGQFGRFDFEPVDEVVEIRNQIRQKWNKKYSRQFQLQNSGFDFDWFDFLDYGMEYDWNVNQWTDYDWLETFFEEEVLEPGQSMDAWVEDFGNTIERTQDAFERRKELDFNQNLDKEHGNDNTDFDFDRPMKSEYLQPVRNCSSQRIIAIWWMCPR